MSPHKEGRNFQSVSGRIFLFSEEERLGSASFAQAISAALRKDYGDTHAAVKIIAQRAGANTRSAKNWLEARNGHNGPSLIALCRHSDRVFEAIVRMSRRGQLLKAKKLIDARQALREILRLLDDLEGCTPSDCRVMWPRTPWPNARRARRS